MNRKGRILILTGDGKGKTTSALGMAVRCAGWNKRVCILQFFKSSEYECGERLLFNKIGIEILPLGIGFSWQKTEKEQREALINALNISLKKLEENYDMIILDEILNVFSQKNIIVNDIVDEELIMNKIKEQSENKDIILTGRGCKEGFYNIADTVTEMKNIKHAYDRGIEACKCIEY